VLACLFACPALTHRTRDLDDAGDDPTVFVGLLIRDRHLELVVHPHTITRGSQLDRSLSWASRACVAASACAYARPSANTRPMSTMSSRPVVPFHCPGRRCGVASSYATESRD